MAGVATAVADNPLVLQAAAAPDPSALLQPYALEVMRGRPRGLHHDHGAGPDPVDAPASEESWASRTSARSMPPCSGEVFTEVMAGTLGPSVRTIAPVKDSAGKVRALVAAGVTVRTVDVAFSGRLPALLAHRAQPCWWAARWLPGCWAGTCAA